MSLVVQKYGGSSLASEEDVRLVAERVAATRRAGHDVVVVVSAMGKTTSQLLDRANRLTRDPCRRELDMLLSSGERISMSLVALAVQELGVEAISLTGPQSGVRTDDRHFNADIVDVRPDRIREELSQGRVVVVAGYQGASPDDEVTTLGRGGSDTTAVALASALEAARCEICSDVEGVFSADPRLVDEAAPLPVVSYDEMLEMARHGASVLNPRAVEWAARTGVTLIARATFGTGPGTVVRAEPAATQPRVAGVACHRRLVWLSLAAAASGNGLEGEVLHLLGAPDVFAGLDSRTGGRELLISATDVANPDGLPGELRRAFGSRLDVRTDLGSVSIVGLGVGGDDAPPARATASLAGAGIDVSASFKSKHAHAWVVPRAAIAPAVQLLHEQFVTGAEAPEAVLT